jgi:osmoprotectant transport system ATP-binding protein
MPSRITYKDVTVRSAAGDPILSDVALDIAAGEAVAFIGRSGAGKTTALRLINRMARPASGEVLIDGLSVPDDAIVEFRRRTGYVIQGSGLFPHRTVYDNVATVPRLLGWPADKTRQAAERLMGELGLPFERYAVRFPRSLSGGEQQRVGIVRALISDPAILLCDEPFGALDPLIRRDLQESFAAMRAQRAATIVFVTHDVAEAMRVADRVVLFDGGRVVDDLPSRDLPRATNPLARAFVATATLPEPA